MNHPKAATLDFADVLARAVQVESKAAPDLGSPFTSSTEEALLEAAHHSVKYGAPSTMQVALTNADRAFGARLAGELARKHGAEGLPDATVVIEATGTAGQSFGAFATHGMLLVLEGAANDYAGKGLSGGVVAVRPPARAPYKAHENVIVGNTCLYGATSGKAFFAGRAGERFAVRNSGATAVVEGVGDHGCEYMTRGLVVVLGKTGRNFGAGMSGGIAYVLDEDGSFASKCNMGMVELHALDDPAEVNHLHALLVRHNQYTGSSVARGILDAWDDYKAKFVKVMPTEYRQVLERQLNLKSDMAKLAAV
jgi:glutamate synthase (NADPH/NADH) large chain